MSSNISFTGLASGLNITSLVQNVLRFNQSQINQLNQTVTSERAQQKALQGVQTSLQTLQLDANQLAQPFGSVFDQTTVASSNSNVVTAATGSGAQTGVTNLQVLSVAQANQIASQGFDGPNSVITQGTFQIQAGGQSATLTIDSTNDTLNGLASAINNAGIGVTATVVDTGSGTLTNQPYRLLLSSNSTGVANAIQITNNLATDNGGAVQPNFSTTQIGPAAVNSNFSGTSAVTANSGAGNYTGTSNDTFTFTVANGGTVGTDNGITLNYSNSTGTQTGTITLNSTDANTAKDVVDGLQVSFGAGTLNAGDQFTVNVYSPVIQQATNAQVQLGVGSGALVVQNSSNTITSLIPGVTLSLKSAAPGQTIQLNVSNDVSAATTAITNFVNDYNSFATNFATQTAYTPGVGTAAGTAGPLNGVLTIQELQSQIEQTITATPANMSAQLNQLGLLGITPTSSGQLQIDNSQLNNVLSGGVPGISFSDVGQLFGLRGQSSSSGVQFATATSSTLPSGSTPYTVHITQAATQAAVTSTNPIASSTVIDGSNDTLSLTISGHPTGSITIPSGTYSQQGLASTLQTAINNVISANGSSVTVTSQNNGLVITSNGYGSRSKISVNSGTALSDLGFTGTESAAGTDVAGSFVVNGVTEPATGTGQILQGKSTNTNTAGLTIAVTYTPSQIQPGGTDSTLVVSSGIASNLNSLLQGMLDPVNGQLTQLNNQFATQIQNTQTDITNQTTAMNAEQASLMSQYAALETVLANLQATSNLLTSELNASTTTAGPTLSQLSGANSSSSSTNSSSNSSSNSPSNTTTG